MSQNKQQHYAELAQQVASLVEGESDYIANMANISALLYWTLKDVNWAGFYLLKDSELVLGPFHGQPACIRIPIGKGVCGTAVSQNSTQLVYDVHEFAGHIACDAASNSEVVIPVYANGEIFAVLDIDSPLIGRFDQTDVDGLQLIVDSLQASLV
ncbi:GAF domain-containing protein [Paraglaciecola hydrolytica]|uniref:GAF domain-containing protein n=1 Tax=Paraglaciecola hydrolytica TaxID=1799789 RepID=A0A136A1G7_9ALTE|nr:GAF domain-containing protein [Paraglaciecola hydrolytica]KXI29043.1 GAF domain-containing protein [Paraglaciecola hydrolytica]